MRQTEQRTQQNKHIKSTMKTHIKNYLKSLEEKDLENAHTQLRETVSFISKAASKGVIHKRNASRKISRLTRKYNSRAAGE
jgi:small subunit ribosomal protein S20